MVSTRATLCLLVAVVAACTNVDVASAFSPVSLTGNRAVAPTLLFETEGEGVENSAAPPVPQEAAVPRAPPTPPQKRLDPLLASLTRMDPTATQGKDTTNIPFIGEIPKDGALLLYVPAAFAMLGFLYSFVIAFNASDEIVGALYQVSDDISQTATQKANMVYDENVCRGLCSSQEADLESMRSVMQMFSGSK